MNVDYLNSFIEASKLVLKSVANLNVSVGKPYLPNSEYPSNTLLIMIGLTGELNGQVIISMSENIACEIASAMMMGMPVTKLDEMSKSAVSEAGNMILGNASAMLFEKGKQINITPPAVAMGNNMVISMPSMKKVCVPLNLSSGGTIELEIAVTK